jgi:plasmid stability protein
VGDKSIIIDHGVKTIQEVEAATHYRSSHGEVSRIVKRDRVCKVCDRTTRIATDTGVWSTFTRQHIWAGCFEKKTADGRANHLAFSVADKGTFMNEQDMATARLTTMASNPSVPTIFVLDCANCDVEVFRDKKPRGPFCSAVCKETASFVRYHRRVNWRLKNEPGFVVDDEMKKALQVRMAFIVSGGYDDNAHTIPVQTREQVKTRDDGKCVLCGEHGEEIDHIDGPGSELENLRLLCRACHWEKTRGNMGAVPEGSPLLAVVGRVMERVNAAEPVKVCDANDWDQTWRVELARRIRTE